MKKRMPFLLIFILLNACDSKEDQKLTRFIEETLKREARPLANISEAQRIADFIYPETGKRRNPFRPLDAKNQPMQYVGSLKQGNRIYGLLALPDGQVKLVQAGEDLGHHYGKIIHLDEELMVIEESGKSHQLKLKEGL